MVQWVYAPTSAWVPAPVLKLLLRMVALTLVIAGASLVVADELIIASLVVSTVALAIGVAGRGVHEWSSPRTGDPMKASGDRPD